MNAIRRSSLAPKVLAGILLCLLGVLFILDNFGVINAGDVWDYWPLLLVGLGFSRLMRPRRPGDPLWGILILLAGVFFLLRNLNIFWISFHKVWPVALVVIGLYLIWQALGRRRGAGAPAAPGAGERAFDGAMAGLHATEDLRDGPLIESTLDEFALLGGGNRIVRSADFRYGTVTAIIGGFVIDLREAVMTGPSAEIEVFVLMGGATFRVPESWSVEMNVTPVLGGTDYKARIPAAESASKKLIIRGVVIMGGVEIKN